MMREKLLSAGVSEEIVALMQNVLEECLKPARPPGRPRVYASRTEQQRAYRERRKQREKELALADIERLKERRAASDEGEREAWKQRKEGQKACEKIHGRVTVAARGNVEPGLTVAPIFALIKEGCDLEADVLPVVAQTVAELPRPLRSWAKWLVEEILRAREGRLGDAISWGADPVDLRPTERDRRRGAGPIEVESAVIERDAMMRLRRPSDTCRPSIGTNLSRGTVRASSMGTRRGSALVEEGKDRRDFGASSICH
jgi:hypothetical protein